MLWSTWKLESCTPVSFHENIHIKILNFITIWNIWRNVQGYWSINQCIILTWRTFSRDTCSFSTCEPYHIVLMWLAITLAAHDWHQFKITQCNRQISNNAPFYNRNLHTGAHFCYKMVHSGMWDWCVVVFVWQVLCIMNGIEEFLVWALYDIWNINDSAFHKKQAAKFAIYMQGLGQFFQTLASVWTSQCYMHHHDILGPSITRIHRVAIRAAYPARRHCVQSGAGITRSNITWQHHKIKE